MKNKAVLCTGLIWTKNKQLQYYFSAADAGNYIKSF